MYLVDFNTEQNSLLYVKWFTNNLVYSIEKRRAYRKVCTELGHSVMQISNELGDAYWSEKVSYKVGRMWRNNCLTTP